MHCSYGYDALVYYDSGSNLIGRIGDISFEHSDALDSRNIWLDMEIAYFRKCNGLVDHHYNASSGSVEA